MDYSASEYSWKTNFNLSTFVIDFFASIGWIWDRKTADDELVAKRRERTGDKNIKIKPNNSFVDNIIGIFVYMWVFWVIVILRMM